MGRLRRKLKGRARRRGVAFLRWERRAPDSALGEMLGRYTLRTSAFADQDRIEARARTTAGQGALPLWSGYHEPGGRRTPNKVRTPPTLGRIYRHLVVAKQPDLVVEFGTAFGVSGMYWLSGLEANERGRLVTFEPNEQWRELAIANLAAMGTRFESVLGTFEEEVDATLGESELIDIAFIDAIHRGEFVVPQVELVVARSSPGALVLIDDVNFSDDMRACWARLAVDARSRSSVVIDDRVGVIELR